ASVLALFAKKAAFLRTPKTSERTSWWYALRANWAETFLALCGAAGIACALTKVTTLSGPLLAGLLFVPTLGLAAAPFNSWGARRAALPAWLRERRRTEYRRDRHAFTAGVAAGAMIAVGGVAAAAIALMLNGHHFTGPTLVGPVQSPTATTPVPTPTTATPTTTPTLTTTTPAPATTTPAATPTPTPTQTTATPPAVTQTSTTPAVAPTSTASGVSPTSASKAAHASRPRAPVQPTPDPAANAPPVVKPLATGHHR
ncbi:MAG TPA: hypothetical protein VI365_25170, partial [Trebonia sp.]